MNLPTCGGKAHSSQACGHYGQLGTVSWQYCSHQGAAKETKN